MSRLIFILLFSIAFTNLALAQLNPETINLYLMMVANGKINEVKTKLPDLIVNHPNDPGVQLLLGVCIEDAFKAVEIYEKIVREHWQSEWADDAYWRLVQFYAMIGDTTRARYELDQFRYKHPTSQFIQPAADVVRSAVGLAKYRNANAIVPAMPAESTLKNISVNTQRVPEQKAPEPVKAPAVETEVSVTKLTISNEKELSNEPKSTPDLAKEIIAKQIELTKQEPEPIVDIEEEKKEESKPTVLTLNSSTTSSNQTEKDDVNIQEEKTGYFGLQVGVFDSREAAEQEMKKFLRQRMRTEVKPKDLDGTTKFAVVIGNYSSKESAEAAKIIVQQNCNCTPIVFEK